MASRATKRATSHEWWWEAPEALCLMARSLAHHKFAVLDGFLPESEWRALATDAQAEFKDQRMTRGAQLSGLAAGEDGGDWRNIDKKMRKWTIRGDHSAIWSDDDPTAAAN